jgi:hypothetical protein
MWFINELFAWIFGADFSSVLKYLLVSGSVGGGTAVSSGASALNISGILRMSYNICQDIVLPIADCMLIMYFLITLTEKASHDNFSLEQFGKELMKVVIYHILIINTFALMMQILSFGNALIRETNSYLISPSDTYGYREVPTVFGELIGNGSGKVYINGQAADQYDAIKSQSDALAGKSFMKQLTSGDLITYIITLLKYGFFLLAPFVISVIAYGAMIMAALSRVLQISIRLPLAPIGLADLYNGGIHSRGMSTLKGLIALAAQGMVILMIIGIGNILCSAIMTSDIFVSALLVSVVKLSQISLLGKSLEVTKEIFGV